jgi:hypothetical protein
MLHSAFPAFSRLINVQLLAHHGSMDREEHPDPADTASSSHAEDASATATATATNTRPAPSGPSPDPQSAPETRKHEPEEKAKRTKHSRVQKREKELCGLVTPVFLPLLDARDISPKHEKKQPTPKPHQTTEESPAPAPSAHATPTRDADTSTEGRKPRREDADMDGGSGNGSAACESGIKAPETPKKSRRASSSTMKKSALRQTNTNRSRRKRVSLVIDGQTVLPADTVTEPALTSPTSEATSASNSTASLDDMIDPRLTTPDPPRIHTPTKHYDAVHHSLPLPMSNHIHSPTKPLVEPHSLTSETTSYRIPTPNSSHQPPSTVIHDPYPTNAAVPDATIADSPLHASPTADDNGAFNTYVGGLHGSGIDDVEQAGSYGYPSSLGASYLESYMQSRPLRVRMEAASKAGLDEREKKVMMSGGKKAVDAEKKEKAKDKEEREKEKEKERKRQLDVDEDMDIMGEMEGF